MNIVPLHVGGGKTVAQHLVSMGANISGSVHLFKDYGAMAAARPVLYLGPRRSHVGEL